MALIYHAEAIQKVSTTIISELFVEFKRSRDGAVVRALASHRCDLGSNPGLGVMCGLSLMSFSSLLREVFLWVLRFSSLLKHQIPNSDSIWRMSPALR